MKKVNLKISILIMFLVLVLPFVCNVFVSAAESYTVRFYTTETNYTTQTVVSGDSVIIPATPVKTGHAFKGWTLDNTVENPAIVNVSSYRVYSDVDFFAVFTPNRYKVTFKFYTSNGLLQEKVVDVLYNEMPKIPTISNDVNGSSFIGWDKEISVATENVTYTAQYSEKQFVIQYIGYDGNVLNSVYKNGMSDLTSYEPEQIEGKNFKGWSLSPDSKNVIDENFRTNADVSLYAVYTEDFWYQYKQLSMAWQIGIPFIILVAVVFIICILKKIFGGR